MKTLDKDAPTKLRSVSPKHLKSLSKGCPEPLETELKSVLAQCHGKFLRYLEHRLGNRDEAEDVLQDFYVRVIVKSRQIRSANATVAWLRQVLKSVLVDYFRRQSLARKVQREIAADPRAAITTQEHEFDRSKCTCFYKFIPSLKPEYAEVLRRVDLAGESRDDAALAAGITTGNIRVRLHRGRQALRRSLQHSCTECRSHGCFHSPEDEAFVEQVAVDRERPPCNALDRCAS